MLRSRNLVGIVFSLLLLQGCGSKVATPSTPPTNATTIKHIVVIMQENRSVDNLFNGFPGADTVMTATQKGKSVTLQPVALEQGIDVDHSHTSWLASYDK